MPTYCYTVSNRNPQTDYERRYKQKGTTIEAPSMSEAEEILARSLPKSVVITKIYRKVE